MVIVFASMVFSVDLIIFFVTFIKVSCIVVGSIFLFVIVVGSDANTKNKTLLEIIEYYYYSKRLSEAKDERKNDNKGIQLIKEFIKNMYYAYGKEVNKKDD